MPWCPCLKIFDASAAVALFGEIDRPGPVDDLRLGRIPAMPGYVMDKELLSARSEKGPKIRRGRARSPSLSSAPDEPSASARIVRGLGQGESETMIACKRAQRQGRAGARRRAAVHGGIACRVRNRPGRGARDGMRAPPFAVRPHMADRGPCARRAAAPGEPPGPAVTDGSIRTEENSDR